MKKLKTSIAILILALLTITGLIQPITTAYAADSYTVRATSYGDYHKALYVKNTTTGEDVVGYCYNAHKGWPGIREQSVKKFENASNDQFLRLASGPRDREKLRENVLGVCYKGFPRDGIGLKKKYNLSNDVFRFITQSAVWYYTDSLNIEDSGIWITYSWMVDDNARKAYNELINTPVTLPSNYTLDLYENASSSQQNILSTKLRDDYVPPKEYSIEFSKKDDELGGAELAGATLQVLEKNGTLIKEWITNGTTQKINLVAGEYIFREKTEPNGYVKVSDIYFKVDDSGAVSITSKTNNGDIAEGATGKLTVVDKKVPIVYKSLTVNKVWELYGHDGNEIPDSVQVQLYENGVASGDPVTLKKSEGWSYTWKKLDSSKTYTVKEVTISDNWISRIETGNDGNFTIYNSMKPELTVEKIVRDGDWADKTRKFDFKIELKDKDGNLITGNFACVIENKEGTQLSEGNLEVKDGLGTFKLGHEQKIRIKGLPIKVTYRVEELSDANAAFTASYATVKNNEQKVCPSVQITNENTDNKVTVYNTFKYIVDTGIDLNNKYLVPGAVLIIAGILLFGGIAVFRFRKRLK